MKYLLFLLIAIVLLTLAGSAQSKHSIAGTWVESATVGSDAYGDTYIFRKNGSFTFTYSGYKWSGRRIISFSGQYRFTQDSIFFRITETLELLGGHIDKDGPPNGLGWIVVDGQKKVIKQKHVNPIGLDFSYRRDEYHEYILVDKNEFMLVPSDAEEK